MAKTQTFTTKTFAYVALDSMGRRISKTMRAESETQVLNTLQQRDLVPLSIREKKTNALEFQIGGRRLKGAALADYTRQIYALVNAGIPLVDAIRSVARTTKNAEIRKMLLEIADSVQEGSRYSEALSKHPKSFDSVYVSYIQAGEATGGMTQALQRLTISLDKKVALRRKVKSVMTYPVLVSAFILLIVGAILMFLVPQFESLYSQLGGQLPGPTRMLMKVSEILVRFVWAIPLLILGLFIAYRQTKDNLEVGTAIDKVRFRLPIIGSLLHKLTLFRWAETLAGAIDSGVPTIEALELAAAASGSRWQRAVAPEFVETLRVGRKLGDVMPKHAALYPISIQTMIETGERSGDLAEMLGRVANVLDDEIENIVGQLASTLEVALLATMGVVVGGIMIALYLPIFNAPALLNQ